MSIIETTNSNLVSNVKDFIKTNFVDQNAQDFAKILEDNFAAMDKNKDDKLSVSEIKEALNFENLPDLLSKIDSNGDGVIGKDEVSTEKKVAKALTGIVADVLANKDSSEVLSKATQKLGKAFYLNSLAQNAVEKVVDKII